MSSLNVELVHIILTCVSSKTVGVSKNKDFKMYQAYDFTSKNKFTLDYIEIENREEWDFKDVIDKEGQNLFGIRRAITQNLIPKVNTFLGMRQESEVQE